MIVIFKLFYNTIAACQRPVGPFGPLLSKRMYVCMYVCICTGLLLLHFCNTRLYHIVAQTAWVCNILFRFVLPSLTKHDGVG